MIAASVTIMPSAIPPLDPRRALELQAWCVFIDRWLDTGPDMMPFTAARRLLSKLADTGIATVKPGSDFRSIVMLGILARARGSDYELLMNWRAAAMARLEGALS
ncbi:hypothetical protein OEW28_18775 [Defluviimonas sp. WL0002]|uniref:Uncharacterized protein n=1 Tax=Albidovulum marisflavi TaxID=2984159 RepID=A0ABT2ZHP0_9RHOB|nr:hypothetical protein [Defluviimonas sp. WL0002]MCV2870662.1 hypothetical protein [Defluviimonas sp. WL0002]